MYVCRMFELILPICTCIGVLYLKLKMHCNIPTLENKMREILRVVHSYCVSWSLISEQPNKDDKIGAVNVLHVYLTFQSPCLFLFP